ncbi:MAG: DUF721 domain-containing protein [Phycisphaerae bacterium]|nr:DUF721 domain-containing protein [Phycisphaerae bacterium]
MNDAQLQTIWQQRRASGGGVPLSGPLSLLMKRSLAKRVRQLGALASVWDELVPATIRDHTALEGFSGGTLTVTVDSASHRFQLQTLLAAGLLKQLQSRLPMALNKVKLVPGQFYCLDETGAPRYEL